MHRVLSASVLALSTLALGTFLACSSNGTDATASLDDAGTGDAPSASPLDAEAATDAGDDAATVGRLAEQIVGAAGGTVTASNGVTVEMPAGALANDVTVTVDEVSGAAAPAGATSVGPTIQLGPEGQTFTMPVKVTLPWNGGSASVVIAHSPRGGATWMTLSEDAGSNSTHVWASTSSFSWFQPVSYLSDGGVDGGDPASCAALEQGQPIKEAKAAFDALKNTFNALADCTQTQACFEHKTPSGTCYGIGTGATTTALDNADATFHQKYSALSPAEVACYGVGAAPCGQPHACQANRCM